MNDLSFTILSESPDDAEAIDAKDAAGGIDDGAWIVGGAHADATDRVLGVLAIFEEPLIEVVICGQ